MAGRKRIGVIFCNMQNETFADVAKGIIDTAAQNNYDTFFFTTLATDILNKKFSRGENNIYNLINFSKLDGVIFVQTSFHNTEYIYDVKKYLRENCGVPVVVAGDTDDSYKYVVVRSRKAIENMTDHFIDDHGYKKIYCLTGIKGNICAEDRLLGYLDSMKKHGLDVPGSYVIYGDFWKMTAQKLANDIASNRIEKPDAVICGSDTMALSLISTLSDLGIKVPEDIAVSGYDNLIESASNVPPLTSHTSADYELGVNAFVQLYNIMPGNDKELPFTDDGGQLIKRASCGCHEDVSMLLPQYKKYITSKNYMDLFKSSYMEENVFTANNLNELIKTLYNFTYLIENASLLIFCLCDYWYEDENSPNCLKDGYSEQMNCYCLLDAKDRKNEAHFDTSEMIDNIFLEGEPPSAYFFAPLHFIDHCFGYTVLGTGTSHDSITDIYKMWMRNISNSLELIRVRRLLYLSSVRDALTGLYNRRGFDEKSKEMYSAAIENKSKLMIIGGDLDGLKFVNDNYGHHEGDIALNIVGSAIKAACKHDEFSARTGGDEFVIMAQGESIDEGYANNLIQSVYDFLDKFNANSEYDYNVGVSFGFCLSSPDGSVALETLVKQADDDMYTNKYIRKGGRRKTDLKNIIK